MIVMMGGMVLLMTVLSKVGGGDMMKDIQEQQAQMQEEMVHIDLCTDYAYYLVTLTLLLSGR